MLTTLALVLQLQAPLVVKNFLPGKTLRDTTRNYIVIHNDGASLSATATRAILKRRRLSYHYFISRTGEIHQWKDLTQKALHAGVSKWNGISDWNTFSIGVCLQGTSFLPYTEKDVAYPKTRKKDPGEHFQLWRIYNDITYDTSRQVKAP